MNEPSPRRGGSSLAAYLLEIQRFPILTPAEEASVVARLQHTNSESEVHRLVQSNLRFVVKIARQYQGRSVPLDDLISHGNLGLLRAASRYEPSRGARFLSCAVWWIRKATLDALEGRGALIRVPRYQHQKSQEARRFLPIEVSLDTPVSDDSSRTLGEILPDSSAEDPMEVLLRREVRARVRWALHRLTPREIRVLSCRYGFGGRRARTLGELGGELGMSREAVRQIEARAREKLSKILLGEDRNIRKSSKRRSAGARAAGFRPALSVAPRSRSGRDTPSACTGSCEG